MFLAYLEIIVAHKHKILTEFLSEMYLYLPDTLILRSTIKKAEDFDVAAMIQLLMMLNEVADELTSFRTTAQERLLGIQTEKYRQDFADLIELICNETGQKKTAKALREAEDGLRRFRKIRPIRNIIVLTLVLVIVYIIF